jgi:mRNA-degrading endonuclease RelE of RelBE toxin-antitoxin system
MVDVSFESAFEKSWKKYIKSPFSEKIQKQIKKVIEKPDSGKPMRYGRKGTREIYVKPLRISYIYFEEKKLLVFLDIYHKKEQ